MKKKINCDIAIHNGGGVQSFIKSGDVTGQQILDALENGGNNYILRNGSNCFSMFMSSKLIVDYTGQDNDIFSAYIKSFKKQGAYPFIKQKTRFLVNIKVMK